MADFAKCRLGFLRDFMDLKHSAPRYDAFLDPLNAIDPSELGAMWRSSFDDASKRSPLRKVRAHWAIENPCIGSLDATMNGAPCATAPAGTMASSWICWSRTCETAVPDSTAAGPRSIPLAAAASREYPVGLLALVVRSPTASNP